MAELVEAFCLQNISEASAGFLLALTEEYRIDVDAGNRDNRNILVKTVYKHLVSDAVQNSPDHGAALFLKLYNDLGGELKTLVPEVKPEVKTEPPMPPLEGDETLEEKSPAVETAVTSEGTAAVSVGPTVVSSGRGDVSETLSYHKLRQFKINGTVGDPGQKGCVTYSSLCYQIRQGEIQGYTINEIYGGVIRATEAGNPFRDVLELEAGDFTKEDFMKSLRAHFKERDPNLTLSDLRGAKQDHKETARTFCCRCVALKKRCLNTARAESMSLDEDNVNRTFFQTLYTGLRQNNIRNELRHVLTEGTVKDADLLVMVALAETNEEERLRKMADGEKKVHVNKVTCDDSDSDSEQLDSSSSGSSSAPASRNLNRKERRAAAAALKKNQPKPAQNVVNVPNQDTLVSAQVGKIAAAMEKLATSNATLVADVMALKSRMAGSDSSKPPLAGAQNKVTCPIPNGNGMMLNLPTMAPTAPPFNPTFNPTFSPTPNQFNQGPPQYVRQFNPRTNRPVYLCNACISAGSPYCRHCFKCGSDAHKIGECPSNC